MAQVVQLFPQQTQSESSVEKSSPYQPDYSIEYGDKYQRGLDITEIAKRIRAEIKADIKAGILPNGKYSVTIDRFSGGQSLDVTIKAIDSHKLMLNPARVVWEKNNPRQFVGNLPSWDEAFEGYTPEGERILDRVKDIVNAYNYDGSDSMTDYFNVNFYGKVEFGWEFEKEQKAIILEHLQ
jgi:hypothetical protein